jgi:hypothetical protein
VSIASKPRRTVTDQQPSVPGEAKAQRSAARVTDNSGPTVGGDAHDATVVDTGPDVPVGVDQHILRRIAGKRDDGQIRRRQIRQRVDGWWLPADRVNGRLRRVLTCQVWPKWHSSRLVLELFLPECHFAEAI